jgi:hypothetical protein
MTKRLKVGVLDLLYSDKPSYASFARPLRSQFAGIMPQAVSVWARQSGHDVHYATYFGQKAPESLMPKDLDLVFIVSFTKASALAYALARLFRQRGALTVAAGPHARSFPEDCLRFFDLVIGRADKSLILDVLGGHYGKGNAIETCRPLGALPTVQEREQEIRKACVNGQRMRPFALVPLLASTGCPYHCHFCVDATTPYAAVDRERLVRELRFIAKRFPGQPIGFHDPNFGVQFDKVLGALESIPPKQRNPYIIQASLSVLKPERMPRLKATNCVYIAPGIESWSDYGAKAGTGRCVGQDKMESVIRHFQIMRPYAKGFQANFVFGTDIDRGHEPVELTIEFMRRLPHVFTGIFIPTPFGGTELFNQIRDEGRLLDEMPLSCYYNPYLTFMPAHYGPVQYYEHLERLFAAVTDTKLSLRRISCDNHPLVKMLHAAQILEAKGMLRQIRAIKQRFDADPAMRAFHEGSRSKVPQFYLYEIGRRIGKYGELLSPQDLKPVLPAEKVMETRVAV